jgi:pyruvate-formate lyase-activating enzyme
MQDPIDGRAAKPIVSGGVVLVSFPPWGLGIPPLGLGYLAQTLRDHGWPVQALDGNLELLEAVGPDAGEDLWMLSDLLRWLEPRYESEIAPWIRPRLVQLVDEALASNPSVLGLSLPTMFSRCVAQEFVQEVRRLRPTTLIVAGGTGVSGPADRAPFARDGIDFFVQGDGEQTLLSIVEHVAAGRPLQDLRTEPGVIPWRATSGDPYELFTPRPFLPDLSDLPFPTFEELELNRYQQVAVMMSRGCPRKCQFCENRTVSGPFRCMPAERAFESLAYHVQRGHDTFEFNDVIMNSDVANLERLADLIIDAGWNIRWSGSVSARKEMTSPLLTKLRRSGVARLSYGIESFSPEVLRLMKKGRDVDVALDVLKRTREAGIKAHVFLITGFPGETEVHLRETMRAISQVEGNLAESITVSGCMVPDQAPVGMDADQFGVQRKGPFPHVTWEGEDGNTYEERIDRTYRVTGLLTGLGFERSAAAGSREVDFVLVCLPDEEASALRRRELAEAVARESHTAGIRTRVVDLHAVVSSSGRRTSRDLQADLLERFDNSAPFLSSPVGEALDAILCSHAPYVVLWPNGWNDGRALRFAEAIRRTDPGLCVLAAGLESAPHPPPDPFYGVLLGNPVEAFHRLIRAHRVGAAPARNVDGLYALVEGPGPSPLWLNDVAVASVARSDRGAEDTDACVQVVLRWLRASGPLRLRLELGSQLFERVLGGPVVAETWTSERRIRAGTTVTLEARVPRWFFPLTRAWMKLRAFTKRGGESAEVLHALLDIPRDTDAGAPGSDEETVQQEARVLLERVRRLEPGRTGQVRLTVRSMDEFGQPERPVLWDQGYPRWPMQYLRRSSPTKALHRDAGGPTARSEARREGVANPVAARESELSRLLVRNAPLVKEILSRLASVARSPLPGWVLSGFSLGSVRGGPVLQATLQKGAERMDLELLPGDADAPAFAQAPRVKLRHPPGRGPKSQADAQGLRKLCAMLDGYLRERGA